jgi:hypothetical protein
MTCSSTGTTRVIAISITTWRASPPRNARRQNANAGASSRTESPSIPC